MKVFVMLEAAVFQKETYVGVTGSLKSAQKRFREIYPHMRPWDGNDGRWTSTSDNSENPTLLFIREEEI